MSESPHLPLSAWYVVHHEPGYRELLDALMGEHHLHIDAELGLPVQYPCLVFVGVYQRGDGTRGYQPIFCYRPEASALLACQEDRSACDVGWSTRPPVHWTQHSTPLVNLGAQLETLLERGYLDRVARRLTVARRLHTAGGMYTALVFDSGELALIRYICPDFGLTEYADNLMVIDDLDAHIAMLQQLKAALAAET